MNTEKYTSCTTDEFALDKAFSDWVLSPGRETDEFWAEFLQKHPEKKSQIKDAAIIVKAFQPVEEEVPSDRLEEILGEILRDTHSGRRRLVYSVLKVAAVSIAVLGISGLLILRNSHRDPDLFTHVSDEKSEQGRVVLSDGSTYTFDTEQTTIKQTDAGKILINQDTVEVAANPMKSNPDALNQIIIPYGLRSEVTLSDGTHIWLNSGSKLSYPAEFTGKTREVYLSGEAFFDVESDTEKAFHVITRDIRIAVLGTRFNVTSYEEDAGIQTVLLTGKVNIRKNTILARNEEILPGERVVFNRESGAFVRDRPDLQYVTSWVYGYLIFEKEPTPTVFKKLERYYNQPIITEEGLSQITFSGKLDLKENLNEVLEIIAFASSLTITLDNGHYFVKQ